jgi:hypothetical protein
MLIRVFIVIKLTVMVNTIKCSQVTAGTRLKSEVTDITIIIVVRIVDNYPFEDRTLLIIE